MNHDNQTVLTGQSREVMIQALIKRELECLIDHPENLQEVTDFIANGHFSHYWDEKLTRVYNRDILGA